MVKIWSMNGGILMVDKAIYPNIIEHLNGTAINHSVAQKFRVTNGRDITVLGDADFVNTSTSVNEAESVEQRVVILNINGMIRRENILSASGQSISYYGTDYITECIRYFVNDKSIKAIILDVNSGGGFSNAVANLIDAITQFRKTGRKVYASVDIACSAGYHLISFCDYIVANSRASLLGCIGTMWSATDYSKMHEKAGIREINVVSSQTPNKTAEFTQAMQGNAKLLQQNIIDPTAQVFIDDVLSNRKIKNQNILKGASVIAEKAIEAGLCDAIMPMSQLIELAIKGGTITTTPKNSSQSKSNIQPKNQMEKTPTFDFFGIFSRSKAGEATAQEEGQLLSQLANAQNIESNLNMTISNQNTQIGDLQNRLNAETTAKETALTQVSELTNKVTDLESKLDKTIGSPAQTAVLSGNEIITSAPEAELVPGLKDELDSFNSKLLNRVNNFA